jgi:hypothetical protein
MAGLAPQSFRWRMFFEPMHGPPLVVSGLLVWLAGAAYCHGYERLLTGGGEWAGSLTWSAIAVLPWFALFEWTKQPRHRHAAGQVIMLAGLVVAIAALSIALEYAWNATLGEMTDRLGLLVMRRLPAIGATLLLIALARKAGLQDRSNPASADLSSIADAIEWVAAADNYVELHILGRTTLRRMTMADATRALKKHGFVRIHRKFLVKRAQISAIAERSVRLKSGEELPVGAAFAPNLRS